MDFILWKEILTRYSNTNLLIKNDTLYDTGNSKNNTPHQ